MPSGLCGILCSSDLIQVRQLRFSPCLPITESLFRREFRMKVLLAVFCLLPGLLIAENALWNPINLAGRKTISLDGTWHAIVDPYETGLNARFYENRKPKTASELVEYNFDTSDTLKVPGDWNTQRESL